MTTNSDGLISVAISWAVAAVGGAVVAVLLWVLGGWTFMQGAFMGVLAFLASGVLLWWTMCRPLPPPGAAHPSAHALAPVAKPAVPAPAPAAPAPSTASATPRPAATASPLVKPMAELKGEAEIDAHKDDWKYVAPAKAAEPAGKPAGLAAARGGKPDDLKRIKGVGPKLEALLHSMGYFHFDQIAAWTAAEVAWVDENLEGFKGRVTRDNWVSQAALLATGAETEFSKRVDQGDVY